MHKIEFLKILTEYKIFLKFEDGTEGVLNLDELVGKGVFSCWNIYENFKKVSIGTSGELVWECGVDLCPDSLYMKITNKTPRDLFPSLKKAAMVYA